MLNSNSQLNKMDEFSLKQREKSGDNTVNTIALIYAANENYSTSH